MTASRLHVAVVAPPFYEVPPRSYGGVERVCGWLVDGLLAKGHRVTLVGAGEPRTRAHFVRTFTHPQPEDGPDVAGVEIVHTARAAAALAELAPDVVHDHTRAGPLTAPGRAFAPTVVTSHTPLRGPEAASDHLRALNPWLSLVAISDAQRRDAPHLRWAATVHNGIPVDSSPFRADKDDFVLYLGRISAQKGVHLAMDAARAAGRPIVLAGCWTIPEERAYFEAEIRPRLASDVTWLESVAGAEKEQLLSRAACLLFPIRWHEPFGLVVVEALACGTPVVALRAGAAPELLEDGVSGVLCGDPGELPAAVDRATRLDPATCRRSAQRFDVSAMVAGYESVYRRALDGFRHTTSRTAPTNPSA
ncbi:glycosyltransferase family 4 protein [Streptomyces cinnabarinus]|uniref:Glycosyltransferase family 4 protein n=1 Tax=Streptomyces cinnabarinus TaxID=67287 RepID=A0ABY7KR13_9ACTN|nr:glycosyltransferase family 4 protein [Streptomyces cinnabarinus]WAZ25309.1 glycosyltransferase family 4 protein [Streptomyces cinnabarinus]